MSLPSLMNGRSSLLARLALASLLVAACARVDRPAPVSDRATGAAATVAPAGGFSVYDLGATWHDQRGAARTLASLRGRPQAIALVYTHCQATCPLIVGQLKRLEAATTLGLVLVSLDPERDTADRLAAFAAEHELDAARWTLLRGSDDDVRELAVVLGVRYRRQSPTELAHANTITLLDAAGGIVHQQVTLAGTAETIDVARRVAASYSSHVAHPGASSDD